MPDTDFMKTAKTDRDRSVTQRLRQLLDSGDVEGAQNLSAEIRTQNLPAPLANAAQQSVRRFQRSGVLTRMENPDPLAPYESALREANERPGLMQTANGETRYYAPRSSTGNMLLRALGSDPYAPSAVRQAISGQAPEPRAARVPREEPSTPDVGYRGMAGVGLGSVNGKAELYPMAGRANRNAFAANMGALGFSGVDGVGQDEYEGRRSDLVQSQEQARRGQAFEARKAGKKQAEAAGLQRQQELEATGLQRQQELEEKILLETIKNQGVNAPGIQDWMQHLNQVRKDQQQYDEIQAEIQAAIAGQDPDTSVRIGYETRTVGDWQKMLSDRQRPALTPYQEWVGGQQQLGDPRFPAPKQQQKPGRLRRVLGSIWGDEPQAAEPKLTSGYTPAHLAQIAPKDRTAAAEVLRKAGHTGDAEYLMSLP